MDKDQKPQPSNDRPAEKKPTPQTGGGNLVWYMLGLGVLLLLMVTLFNSGNELRPGWSDLIKLVEVSGKNGTGYVDIADPSNTQAPAATNFRSVRYPDRHFGSQSQGHSATV